MNEDTTPHDACSAGEGPRRTQLGALCWRMHRGRAEVLLITSRDTGRWVIPKGWPMEGMTHPAAAAVEAWEEAGVTGDVTPTAYGCYHYDKRMGLKPAIPCAVSVFPLRVAELAEKFPERKQRRRKWFSAAKAASKVDEPELRSLFLQLADDPDRLLHPHGPDVVTVASV